MYRFEPSLLLYPVRCVKPVGTSMGQQKNEWQEKTMLNKKRITLSLFLVGLATLFGPAVLGHCVNTQSAGHVIVADGTAPPAPPIPYSSAKA